MSSEKNTPRLRFPEFSGEWEEKKLGEVFVKINNGMTYDTFLTAGFPMSRIETISSGEIDFERVGFSEKKPDEKYKLVTGDILLSHINSETRIGRVALYRGGKTLYHGMNLLLLRADNSYNYLFAYYLMDRAEMRRSIQRYAKKAINQASVSTSDIKKISVRIPHSPSEQQKIAECLSSLDELIVAETAKLETLKEQKKGLMQQLFPQQGETTPRLRFPEFSGEWEEKKLGEVFVKINNGMTYDTFLTAGFPMSRIETISSGEIDFERVGFSEKKPDEKYKLVTGDILLSHINSETRIGRVALYRGGKTLYHGMNLLLLRADNSYNYLFAYYLMDRAEMRRSIQRYAKKAINQASVSTSDIKKISVRIPHSPSEQQKIAECLSSLDELIVAETAKLETLKEQKKGLMQQLFPQITK